MLLAAPALYLQAGIDVIALPVKTNEDDPFECCGAGGCIWRGRVYGGIYDRIDLDFVLSPCTG